MKGLCEEEREREWWWCSRCDGRALVADSARKNLDLQTTFLLSGSPATSKLESSITFHSPRISRADLTRKVVCRVALFLVCTKYHWCLSVFDTTYMFTSLSQTSHQVMRNSLPPTPPPWAPG